MYVPECYQYSCCSQYLISYDYMNFGGLQSNYNCFISMFHLTKTVVNEKMSCIYHLIYIKKETQTLQRDKKTSYISI